MRVTSLLHKIWQKVVASGQLFLVAARSLLLQRKVKYAALLTVLVAGSAYAAELATTGSTDQTHPAGSALSTSHNSTLSLTQSAAADDQQNSQVPSVSTNVQTSSNAHSQLDTTVTVNGQDVPVPSDGSTHKTIVNDTGNATVDISHTSTGSGSNTTTTSLDVHIQSSSEGGMTNE